MDRYFTEEQSKALEGYLGFTPSEPFFFTPDIFKAVIAREAWPVFKLLPIDGKIQAAIDSQIGYLDSAGNYFANMGNVRFALLRSCIKGWRNVRDVNGVEIAFESTGDEVTDKVLRLLPARLQQDLEKAIRSKMQLTEEESLGLKF